MTISINDVNAYYPTPSSDAKKIDNSMGKDAFLQILVTQLKNQDPLNPQDNEAFIGQMTQFSILEQLTSMNQKMDELNKLIIEIKEGKASENEQQD